MTRVAFQDRINTELAAMGWAERSWHWIGARLIMVIAGEIRDIPVRANMSRIKLARELGRLEGLAEALKLKAVPA